MENQFDYSQELAFFYQVQCDEYGRWWDYDNEPKARNENLLVTLDEALDIEQLWETVEPIQF